MLNRFGEFFEDDVTRLWSMNRLLSFIAIVSLTVGFFILIIMCIYLTGIDLQLYLGALTTIAIIIAGLGGFNYVAGRVTGAYTQVKVAQAEQGISSIAPVAPLGPTTTINVSGQNKVPDANDVNIKASGDVKIAAKQGRKK